MNRVIGNNLYVNLKPDDKVHKVIWHFRNYNVILPSPFGFDINNYVDSEIAINTTASSYRRLIKDRSVRISNGFIKYPSDDYGFYSNNRNVVAEISNIVELNDNDIIFHYIYDRKSSANSKIIIPKLLLNGKGYNSAVVYYKSGMITVKIYNLSYYDDYLIILHYPDIGKPLDMNDSNRCMQFMANDQSKSLYTRLFLSNI